MKKPLLTALALLFATRAFSTVTITVDSAWLKDASGVLVPTSGLILLVASTSNTSFTPPAPDAFVRGDDVIVAKWDLSTSGFGPGRLSVNTGALALDSGYPLQLYWYPTLTLAATNPGAAGVAYGQYRSDVGADGSAPWFTPGDGANITLIFRTADAGGSNPANAGNASLVVEKTPATVTLGNLDHAYDKTGKSAIGTTAPSGLAVDFMYNGRGTLPTNAGTYLVIGTINDPNYAGSATNTLTITPAALSVAGVVADKVYDGNNIATLTGTAAANGVIAGDLVTLTSRVYDNSANDLFTRFDLEGLEIGDEITLAGPADQVSSFSFEYWGVGGGAGGAFNGPVEVILRFYKNDGNVVAGLTPEARLPGTLLFKSKPFPINPTERSVLVYTEAGDFTNAAAADLLLTEPLPSSFTWTVEFIGLGPGDAAGLDVYSPPVVGDSYDDYWRRVGPGVNDWALRTYEANPPINFGARLEVPLTATFADQHAGEGKLVTINGLTLSGVDAGNYTLTPTITANITPKPVAVAAVTDAKVYDGTTSSVGVPTITPPLANGDSTTVRSQAFQTKDAGVGNKVLIPAITISDGNGGANYTVTLQNFTTGTITVRSVTVVANNWVKTYGDTVAFAGTEYNASGFLGGDGVTSVTLTSDGAPATANVGNHAIVPSAAQGTGLANYAINYLNGTLMVDKATLTAIADNKSRAYGESNPIFTISYEGFVNGDDSNDVDSPPVANTTATTTSAAGDYDIILTSGADNNYSFSLVNGTLTITNAALPKITAISLANGVAVITWNAIAGREYRLQFKDHVTDTDWVELTTAVLATGPTASAGNLVGDLPQRFYRVRLLPAP